MQRGEEFCREVEHMRFMEYGHTSQGITPESSHDEARSVRLAPASDTE